MKRIILAVAILAGVTGTFAVSAGLLATPAAACDKSDPNHTS
ncbi:MAG TPA: hypothetical protein VMB73_03985 [Acetobacteraceae bacterium]|jgi:hypothetical protein|nr:hypothetical protein [Acetobacteraceae bacterium]